MSGTQIFDSTWTADASGNWSDGGNWSTQVPYYYGNPPQQGITLEPVVPGADDAVSLAPGGTNPFTVTFDTTDTVHSLGSNNYATLAVQGGALTISDGGDFGGAVNVTAGTVDAADGWSVYGGFNEAAGADVEVDAGALSVSTGTIAGTVTGAGNLYMIGGDSFTLAAGVAITTGSFELGVNGDGFGSVTTLAGNFAYHGTFLLDNYSGNDAELALNGHNATISGTSSLDAEVDGPGTFTVTGTSNVADGGYSQLSMLGGAVLVDAGTMTQYQSTELSSLLRVDAHAVWDIVSDTGIYNSGTAAIQNNGLFEKTGGTGISYVDANVTNTGTVAVDAATLRFSGTLDNTGTLTGETLIVTGVTTTTGSVDLAQLVLEGGGTIGGKLGGTGEIDVENGGSYAIKAGTVLNIGTLGIYGSNTRLGIASKESFGGALNLSYATLELGSFGFAATGTATLSNGLAEGSGSLTLDNANLDNFTLAGTATLVDGGTITQTGGAQLGGSQTDTVKMTIGAADTYDITGANWLGNPNIDGTGTATIDNAGLFEMTGTSGYATVFHADFTSTGTLAVQGGGLAFDGGQDTLSGSIEGTGSLYLDTSWTLGKAAVTVASLENAGAGTLEVPSTTLANGFTNDGSGTLDLNGHRLALTGTASLDGLIGGTGTLTVSNAVEQNGFAVYGSANYVDAGVIMQDGGAQLGAGATDNVTLTVLAHATYDITGADWLGNPNINGTGTATIANAGLFEMTGTGTATVFHSDFTNTGTLLTNGSLVLAGQTASLAGHLGGSGWLALDTGWTLQTGAVVNVATLENGGDGNLTGAFTYAGTYYNDNGATLDLHGQSLTLKGPATLAGAIGDGGTLSVANATDGGLTVYGAATLIDTGLVTQNNGADLGDGSTDTVTLLVQAQATYDVSVGAWLGNPNIDGTGTSTIVNSGLFENTSTASVDVWHSVFTSTGTLLSTGVLDLIGPTATLSGTLAGSGDIDLSTTWTLAAGATVSVATLENSGAGTLLGNATLQGGLADDGGSTLALNGHALTVDGAATLDGTISGTGKLTLNGDAASLGSSAAINVQTLQMLGAASLTLGGNFSFGGSFIDSAAASTSTIELDGKTLILGGASTLTAGGKGAATFGGGTFENTGSLTQSGKVTLGDTTGAVALTNAASGIWDITANIGVGVSGTGSSFANAGLFEKTAGTGLSVISAAFDNTGTVEVTTGTLEFTGGFINSGTILGTLTTSGGHTFISAAHG